MCLRQKSCIKYAIQALQRFFEDRTEGIVLIVARNVYNSLKRDLAPKTSENFMVQFIPQSNTLLRPHQTFSLIRRVITSQERTTQGDPIALIMYGVATLPLLPLIDMLGDQILTHKGNAKDISVASSLKSLQILLDKLYEHGDAFSYNVFKCHFSYWF